MSDAFLGQAPNAEFAAPVQEAFNRITDGLTADNLQDRVRRERDRFGDDIKAALLKISIRHVEMPKKFPKMKGSAYGDPMLGVAPNGRFLLFAPFTDEGRGGKSFQKAYFDDAVNGTFTYGTWGDIYEGDAGALIFASGLWRQSYEICRSGHPPMAKFVRSTPFDGGGRVFGFDLREEQNPLYHLSLEPKFPDKMLYVPSRLFSKEKWRDVVEGLGIYLGELDPLFYAARTKGIDWERWEYPLMTYPELDAWIDAHPKEERPGFGFITWPAAVWGFISGGEEDYSLTHRLDGTIAMVLWEGAVYVLELSDSSGDLQFVKLTLADGSARIVEQDSLPPEVKEKLVSSLEAQ